MLGTDSKEILETGNHESLLQIMDLQGGACNTVMELCLRRVRARVDATVSKIQNLVRNTKTYLRRT